MRWKALLFAWLLFGVNAAQALDQPAYNADPAIVDLDGYVVYLNAQGPLSYQTLTPHELPPDAVTGETVSVEACQHGLSLPFTANLEEQSGKVSGGWGQGGHEKLLEKLHQKYPTLRGVYDVRLDSHLTRILLLYTRQCLEMTAKSFH